MTQITKSELIRDLDCSIGLLRRLLLALLMLLSPGHVFVTFLMSVGKRCENENVDIMGMLNSID